MRHLENLHDRPAIRCRTTNARWPTRSSEQRIVRDTVAIAERPDGSRVAFRPYPTPLFDADGAFTGAVNMLIDVTDEQSEALQEQAERCRRLAGALTAAKATIVLERMAEGFERTAAELSPTTTARS